MNKDTARDYLPLVQALADGKEIQRVRSNGTSYATEWVDIQNDEQINMRLPASCYRVKPEPSQDNIEISMALEDMAKKIRSMKVHCFDFETKSVQAGTGLVCYSTFTWQSMKSDDAVISDDGSGKSLPEVSQEERDSDGWINMVHCVKDGTREI